jgi:hypothetical protein
MMMPAKRRAKRMVEGLMSAGRARRRERTGRVWVRRGMVPRLKRDSMRKAFRTVDPECCGEGVMGTRFAGDLDIVASR